jgi:hypothetical protein
VKQIDFYFRVGKYLGHLDHLQRDSLGPNPLESKSVEQKQKNKIGGNEVGSMGFGGASPLPHMVYRT